MVVTSRIIATIKGVAPAVMAVLAVACGAVGGKTEDVVVRITPGSPALGQNLAAAYGRVLPDLQFKVVETQGSVSNLDMLAKGQAELGLALADVTYMAYNGRIEELHGPVPNIRGVAVLQPSAV